jgi:hypothetical protein
MPKRKTLPGAVIVSTLVLAVLVSWIGTAPGSVICVGDCDGDDRVTVDEMVRVVDMALGDPDALSCDSLNGSGEAPEVAIVTAVDEALNGCPGALVGTISGTAVKGPVANASVTALAIRPDGMPGAHIGSAMTDDAGHFTMQVGDYEGPFMLQMMGGTFPDEATGTHMAMGTAIMSAVIPHMTAGETLDGVEVTPLTSMAQHMAEDMPGGMTPDNIVQSNGAIGSYCDISDILAVHPMDPTVDDSGANATPDQRNYGMMLAAMSEYALTIGMPSASGMVTAMANDASDGIMNGMMGGTGINMGGMGGMMGGMMMQHDAGTAGLGNAMTSFMLSSQNKSGLTPQNMQSLINKLEASNGVIQ